MHSDRNPGLVADAVFLGVTRPPMRWGVTYTALLACAIVSVEAFLVTGNLLWLATYAPLHGLAWLVCRAEPRFFELARLWGQTRGAGLLANARYWSAASYSPLALDVPDAAGRRTRRVPPVVITRSRACRRAGV